MSEKELQANVEIPGSRPLASPRNDVQVSTQLATVTQSIAQDTSSGRRMAH